jgi:SAM-dependent methyltransferase
MNQAYWDTVAEDYCGNVLSVFDHDTEGLIREQIEASAASEASAADLGCGIGKFTPLLADSFRNVQACDWSERCLDVARIHCRHHANITFRQFDFASDTVPFAPVDFVLCVNVLIAPSLDQRLRAWRMVANQVVHGGKIVLVVPSHESMLYLDFRAVDWRLHEGLSCEDAIQQSLRARGSVRDLHQGICPLQGVATKHYLREELEVILDEHHFDLISLRKLEYPWSAVFTHPLPKIRGPLTWAWLAVARRR